MISFQFISVKKGYFCFVFMEKMKIVRILSKYIIIISILCVFAGNYFCSIQIENVRVDVETKLDGSLSEMSNSQSEDEVMEGSGEEEVLESGKETSKEIFQRRREHLTKMCSTLKQTVPKYSSGYVM